MRTGRSNSRDSFMRVTDGLMTRNRLALGRERVHASLIHGEGSSRNAACRLGGEIAYVNGFLGRTRACQEGAY